MLGEKYKKKTELKKLNVRMSELEFEKEKFNLELEERKQRHKIEMEERQLMVELLKKKIQLLCMCCSVCQVNQTCLIFFPLITYKKL